MHDLYLRLGLPATATWLGNSLSDWVDALGIGLLTFAVLLAIRRRLLAPAHRLVDSELPTGLRLVLHILATTRTFLLLAVSLLVASKYLELGPRAEHRVDAIIITFVSLQLGLWLSAAVRFYLEAQAAVSSNRGTRPIVTIVKFLANIAIWALILLLALDNMGIQVKALITGLGIGGIAVALAVQNILGDLLASVSIALDKPFEIGDALTLDNGYTGTVEAIGIKSTRLRSTTGEQIVLANAEVIKARLRNFGRLKERRAVMRFGIAYHNPSTSLDQVPALLRGAIEQHAIARFERAHCVGFSPAAVEFEAAYVVASDDYTTFLDVQHAINVAFARSLEECCIGFAAAQPLPVTRTSVATAG
jgi:small-conductance mechanosensitive channel